MSGDTNKDALLESDWGDAWEALKAAPDYSVDTHDCWVNVRPDANGMYDAYCLRRDCTWTARSAYRSIAEVDAIRHKTQTEEDKDTDMTKTIRLNDHDTVDPKTITGMLARHDKSSRWTTVFTADNSYDTALTIPELLAAIADMPSDKQPDITEHVEVLRRRKTIGYLSGEELVAIKAIVDSYPTPITFTDEEAAGYYETMFPTERRYAHEKAAAGRFYLSRFAEAGKVDVDDQTGAKVIRL